MSAPIEVVTMLSVKPENIDRLIKELTPHALYAEAHEPGTLRYQIYRQINSEAGTETLIYIEVFKDQKAVDVHQSSEAYKDMLVKGAELGLLIREPDVKILEHVAGFGARG